MRKLVASFAVALVAAFAAPAALSQQNEFIVPAKPLAGARGFHGSAVLGNYLYVFGGTLDPDGAGKTIEKATSTVMKAPILPTGETGPWEETTPLPQPRHYIGNSTLVVNDMVCILGGSNAPLNGTVFATALYTRPLPNGTLLPWTESAPFGNSGLTTVTAVSTPGHVHVIGGLGNNSARAEVWSNAIYSDGSMGTWFEGPKLPFPLWFHSAGVAGGRVYIWGGLPTSKKDKISPYMLSAAILGSGKLGEWRTETVRLPVPFFRGVSSVAGPYLFTISPSYSDTDESNDVWFTQITPNGPTAWTRRQTQIPNRVYTASAANYRQGTMFVGGGRTARGKEMLDAMCMFRLTSQARQLAEQGWMAAQLAHANTVAALPAPDASGQTAAQPTLSYLADSKLRVGAVDGFATYSAARADSAKNGKPLVLYFNISGAAPCEQQNEQLRNDVFGQLRSAASFAWIDTQDYPQLVQQLGVYRVPTWVFYDKTGNEVQPARRVGVQTAPDLAALILPLR